MLVQWRVGASEPRATGREEVMIKCTRAGTRGNSTECNTWFQDRNSPSTPVLTNPKSSTSTPTLSFPTLMCQSLPQHTQLLLLSFGGTTFVLLSVRVWQVADWRPVSIPYFGGVPAECGIAECPLLEEMTREICICHKEKQFGGKQCHTGFVTDCCSCYLVHSVHKTLGTPALSKTDLKKTDQVNPDESYDPLLIAPVKPT